jgi:hypothetical protein
MPGHRNFDVNSLQWLRVSLVTEWGDVIKRNRLCIYVVLAGYLAANMREHNENIGDHNAG